ncbi:hypothetical protein P7C71_g3050, partial [Lecanoromycetidae sp. Uapishka_2]
MPNSYFTGKDGLKFHPKPPRKGTINQRAQRFRIKACCIEWAKRGGTKHKNAKILSYIPDMCKYPEINSTKGFRDLTKEEQAQVDSQNKGRVKWQKGAKGKKNGNEEVQQAEIEALEENPEDDSLDDNDDSFSSLINYDDEGDENEARQGHAEDTVPSDHDDQASNIIDDEVKVFTGRAEDAMSEKTRVAYNKAGEEVRSIMHSKRKASLTPDTDEIETATRSKKVRRGSTPTPFDSSVGNIPQHQPPTSNIRPLILDDFCFTASTGPTTHAHISIEKLIRKASRQGSYTYPRVGGNIDGQSPTNVTAFLLKDKDVGPDRSQRPDILFQIQPIPEQYMEEPTEYMTDDGRVVLDGWMHGVRSFPNILPSTLDSELDGQSIEYYQRQNGAITLYDLIARMPYNYTIRKKTHALPPKQNALSWINRGRTVNKNKTILSMIPEECKQDNSTRAMASDLSHADAEKICAEPKMAEATHTLAENTEPRRRKNTNPKRKTKYNDDTEEDDDFDLDEEEEVEEEDLDIEEGEEEEDTNNEMCSDNGVDEEGYSGLASPTVPNPPPISASRSNPKRKRMQDEDDEPKDEVQVASSRRSKRARVTFSLPKHRLAQTSEAEKLVEDIQVASNDGRGAGKSASAFDPSGNTPPEEVVEESEDDASVAETDSDPEEGDYRHIDPIDRPTDAKDQATIRRALELTRIDFFEKTGKVVPQHLAEEFCYESYASQHKRIQEVYKEHRKWFATTPKLYRLPAWKDKFSKWKVLRPTARNGVDPTGWHLMIKMENEEKRQAQEDAELEREIEREKKAAGGGQ